MKILDEEYKISLDESLERGLDIGSTMTEDYNNACVEEAYEEEYEEACIKTRIDVKIDDIKTIMRKSNMTLQEALAFLDVSEEDAKLITEKINSNQ